MERPDAWRLTDRLLHEQGKGDPFAAAVRATRMPMIITDPRQSDNPIVFTNDAFLKLTGYSRDEVMGHNCRFLQGERTDRTVVAKVHDAIVARQDIRVELLNYRKDGTSFRNALYISPVFTEAGEVQFFFASQLDVTEQAIAQEALRRREAELRLIVDAASDYAIVAMDPERRVTTWSVGAEQTFGWSADEMIGKHVDAFFTPEDRAEGIPALEIATASAEGYAPDERWHQRKDGSRVFVNGSVRPLPRDEHGREQGFIKIAREETERRRTEQRLRESEEFNRRVLASSADCIKVLDLDARLEFMSEGGMCVMEVEDFGAIRGACWPDFWRDEGHAKALAAVDEARRGGTGRFQGFATTMKGTPRWWDVIVSPISGAEGRPEKLLSVSRDVTATKLAEERLLESEERLRLATEAAEVGFWDVDVINDVLVWPARVKAMFGIAADKPVTMQDFFDGLHPDDRERTSQAYAGAADPRRRAVYDVEYRTIGKEDRVVRWVAAKGRGLFNKDGTCTRVIGTAIDVTERKRIEGRLYELNETLEAEVAERTGERNQLWELSLDIMLRCGFDGRIFTVNPAWTEVLGWREDELVGASLFDLIHPDDREFTQHGAQTHAQGVSYRRFENRYRHRDGSYRWISWTTRPAENVITAVGRDVTAEKDAAETLARTEEALRQSQKMEAVGQLTGGLAHDFNNLLAGITGSLELLDRRLAQGRNNDAERYIAAAQGAAKRAAALTHRLLAFSRRQTLDAKPTDVNKLIAGMDDLVRRTVGPAIEVEVVAAGGLWTTLVDANQLENALLNLCINARDAMPDGGKLTIETGNRWIDQRVANERDIPPGQYISMCVSDNGTGMTPDIIANAFDPFFTTKPIGQGTGLGLSMIYGFARQSGGQARIYSELGEGTMVCLYLPRYQGAAESDGLQHEQHEAPRAQAGETVLVVDDEPTVRMLVTEVLEELGYGAIEAWDSVSGLKVLQSDARIDLLVTDVGLPGGMNGRQMADAARTSRSDLKVLFITGYAENAVVGHGHLDAGMHVMTKPFALDALASRIKEIIGS